jgi:hypothetical protein
VNSEHRRSSALTAACAGAACLFVSTLALASGFALAESAPEGSFAAVTGLAGVLLAPLLPVVGVRLSVPATASWRATTWLCVATVAGLCAVPLVYIAGVLALSALVHWANSPAGTSWPGYPTGLLAPTIALVVSTGILVVGASRSSLSWRAVGFLSAIGILDILAMREAQAVILRASQRGDGDAILPLLLGVGWEYCFALAVLWFVAAWWVLARCSRD